MCKTAEPCCPTAQLYGELQAAYDFLNVELFNGMLPPCLITLQRKGGNTFGYFARKRFANRAGTTADEIALNPVHFKNQSFIELMSTLAHEMVHLWQYHFGKPSRSGYHNRQWAEKMLWLGLRPSNTGEPGGRMTGQQMMEYVIPGGRFEVAANKLQAKPFTISWFDVNAVEVLPRGLQDFLYPERRSGRRTKFVCSGCRAQTWGKPSLNIGCLDCELRMEPANHP